MNRRIKDDDDVVVRMSSSLPARHSLGDGGIVVSILVGLIFVPILVLILVDCAACHG